MSSGDPDPGTGLPVNDVAVLGAAGGRVGVVVACVSAMMLRRSTLQLSANSPASHATDAYFAASTAADFQTGPLRGAERSSGVTGLDLAGVDEVAVASGEGTSSSI